MKRSFIDKFIYSITQKPKHYIEIENPPKTIKEKLNRPQDARQMQYNKWSKHHQIYSGSYLPYKAEELSKQGWKEEKLSKEPYMTEHTRKSTGQKILRHGRHLDKNGNIEPTHYHWINPKSNDKSLSKSNRNKIKYFDKFGNICARDTKESHLKPHKTRRK